MPKVSSPLYPAAANITSYLSKTFSDHFVIKCENVMFTQTMQAYRYDVRNNCLLTRLPALPTSVLVSLYEHLFGNYFAYNLHTEMKDLWYYNTSNSSFAIFNYTLFWLVIMLLHLINKIKDFN